jgi:hypothetical protein
MKKLNGDEAMRRVILSMGVMLALLWLCVSVSVAESESARVNERTVRDKIEFMRSEIAYLESEHGPGDEKWQNYKREVEAAAKMFERLKASGVNLAEWLPEFPKKLEEVHTKIPLRLPAGPKGTGRFGAYYVRLKYSLTWDKLWKVSDHPDVVVRFDEFDHRFVFWRGTSYIPCWATYDGAWYTNEFFERRGHLGGCTSMCEPMSDKQCRYSHVRIVESSNARVVVHWRYSPTDLYYKLPYRDEMTEWADWVDEYYTIYPDSIGVRKATIHSGSPLNDWIEYQEGIVVNQPGTIPEDNIEFDAVTFANLKGESKTYVWERPGGPEFRDPPKPPCIQVINFKNPYDPFLVVNPEGGIRAKVYGGHGKNSYFNWWNHWPLNQAISDTTSAESAVKPSHSSLSHVEWKEYSIEGLSRTWIMLNGMTNKPAAELVPLAKSWLYAPQLKSSSRGYVNEGYDQTQRAYVLRRKDMNKPSALKFELAASKASPVVNPAFVVKNWGKGRVSLRIEDEKVEWGKDFRFGYRDTLEGGDLIVWVKMESTKPVKISINPVLYFSR